MTLAETINAERMAALKTKDSATFTSLGVILGEAKQIATKKENREPTDLEVLGVIKKTLEGIAETLKYATDELKRGELKIEQTLLQRYMPTQLSETEIQVIIDNAQLDNLGKIMALFKLHYNGKYDGKIVKQHAETYLKNLVAVS